MEEVERPEKRRKLEGDKVDGVHVLPLVPRSPRVVLNKINISEGVLDRLRKIKKFARERVINSGLQDKNEVAQNAKETKSNIESKDLGKDPIEKVASEKKVEIDQGKIKLWEDNDTKDDTIEVLETSEQWISKSDGTGRREKRKRDENSNANVEVKVAKLYDNKCVAITTASTSFSVTKATAIVKDVVGNVIPTTKEANPAGVQNTTELSTVGNQGRGENLQVSDIENKVREKTLNSQTKSESVTNSAQGKEIAVSKVAQNYAMSGAQPETKKDRQSCYASETTAPPNSGEQSNVEGDSEPKRSEPDDAVVYQLLKDVIEKRTSYFENHLLQKNAQLETRVEHLERENSLLQRTSKRLHLALQEVLKNREKVQQSRTSRGVQVNMNIRLSRTVCQKTSTINIDVPDQTIPTAGISVSQEKSQTHQEVPVSAARSPPSPSNKIPKPKNRTSVELTKAKSAVNETSKSNTSLLEGPHSKEKDVGSSKKSPSSKTVSGGPSSNVKETEEIRVVNVSTVGIQSQETQTLTEGMGHFRLDPRHRHKNFGNQSSSSDAGETGHYRITPRGLEAQPKYSLALTSESLQERSQGSSESPKSREARIEKTSLDRGNTNQAMDIAIAQSLHNSISLFSENSVVDSGRAGTRTVTMLSSSVSNERTKASHIYPRVSPIDASPNSETRSSPKDGASSKSKTIQRPPDLSPSVTNKQNSKFPNQPSSVIPKHSLNPLTVSQQQGKQTFASSKQPSLQSKEVEPDVIIVSPTERFTKPSRTPERREQRETSTRVVTNNVSVSEKERVEKQAEQSRRSYSNPSAVSTRQEIPQHSDRSTVQQGASSGNMGSISHTHSREKSQPQVAPFSTAQSIQTSRQALKNPNRLTHEQPVGNPVQTRSKDAPESTRYASGNQDIRKVVDQVRPRENVPTHRGPGFPPNLIPSQASRVPEQIHPSRSVAYEMRHPHPSQQGLPQQVVAAHQLPRHPVAIFDVRSQQPSAHPMPPQQHIVIRQHHPQQQQHPNAFQQHQVVFPPQYAQQRPINPQQANIPRPQGENNFQTRQTQLQQVSAPMVVHNVPARPDPNKTIPRPQEFVQMHPPRPQQHDPNLRIPSHVIPGNVSQRQGPVVVYQPGALEGTAVRQAAPAQGRSFDRYPPRSEVVTQVQNHPQGPQHHVRLPGPPPQRPPPQRPPPQRPPLQSPPLQRPPLQRPPLQRPPLQRPPLQRPPLQRPPFQRPPFQRPPLQRPPLQSPPLQRPPLQRPPLQRPPLQRPPHMMDTIPPPLPNQDPRIFQRGPERRPQGVPERPPPVQIAISPPNSPPKPSASIAVVENGIVLSWNISPDQNTDNIESYELFACQDDSNSSTPPVMWKKIGVVKALPLPMACTLTQFSTGSRYQFAVRAVDTSERAGPFSDPCVITLKKP